MNRGGAEVAPSSARPCRVTLREGGDHDVRHGSADFHWVIMSSLFVTGTFPRPRSLQFRARIDKVVHIREFGA